jgi:predicted aminopeptidase
MRDTDWRGYPSYDAWFDAPINNAKLAEIAVYSDQVAAFLRLFKLCSSDYQSFYASVRQIGKLDKANRTAALEAADACYNPGQS